MTFTSSPPSRREERQQSMAVLPPPSTITRLPILVMCPNETLDKPVDADVDVLGRFLAAGDVEIAAARRAAADEDRVEILGEQRLHAVDAPAADEFDAEIEDVVAFLVDHAFRQAEFGDLRAHHAAGSRVLIEHHARVADRHEVARHGERGGAAAHERDPLAVLLFRRLGQAGADVVLEIGGDAFEPADRDRLLLDPAAPAGRLARPVAGAPENAREDVRFPIDHVGVGVAARRDQTDVFGNRRVRRAGPLTIHDLVEVVRDRNVGRFHQLLLHAASRRLRWRIDTLLPGSGLPAAWLRRPNPAADTSRARRGFPPLHLVVTTFCRWRPVTKSASGAAEIRTFLPARARVPFC